MSALKVYRNDVTEWVVAESPEDAEKVVAETGAPPPDDPNEWIECSPDKEWTCHDFDGKGNTKTMTFREWIAHTGRGYLGTTEY